MIKRLTRTFTNKYLLHSIRNTYPCRSDADYPVVDLTDHNTNRQPNLRGPVMGLPD